MKPLSLDILKTLQDTSSPYSDISKLQEKFDISDEYFIAAFQELDRNGFIAPATARTSGLRVGAGGYPSWSVVDLYVTDSGKNIITPTKPNKIGIFIKITENPLASAIISALVLSALALGYTSLDTYLQEKPKTQEKPSKVQQVSQP